MNETGWTVEELFHYVRPQDTRRCNPSMKAPHSYHRSEIRVSFDAISQFVQGNTTTFERVQSAQTVRLG
jgi:hypothetical protein